MVDLDRRNTHFAVSDDEVRIFFRGSANPLGRRAGRVARERGDELLNNPAARKVGELVSHPHSVTTPGDDPGLMQDCELF